MTLALLLLTLRMKAILPPAPLRLPRPSIHQSESHAYRRQRRPQYFAALRFNA